jgi:hypothetical protein
MKSNILFNFIKINNEIVLLVSAAILNAASWIWVHLSVPAAAFPVLISYNIFWQQDILGERTLLFTAPLLGALMIAINAVLIAEIRKSSPTRAETSDSSGSQTTFLTALIATSTFGLQIAVLTVAWFVIQVNT